MPLWKLCEAGALALGGGWKAGWDQWPRKA